MAASGTTPVSLYYSTTPSATPSAGNLVNGELAINIADGKLFYKDNLGAVKQISSGGGSASPLVNRIFNGQMIIDQRNSGASVSAANGLYTLDRWNCGGSVAGKFTIQRSSVAPPGFINSMLCTSTSAYSVGSADNYGMQQTVEGLNMTDFEWGTATAQQVTLSFWVRSSLTGTFGGSFTNDGYNRSYVFSYTISSANTWEKKSVTLTGDTTGTWLTTNGAGTRVFFSLGTGSSRKTTAGSWNAGYFASVTGEQSVVGTSGATFYLTGVQLEKSSTVSPFDYRLYTVELALCQRYFQRITGGDRAFMGGSLYSFNWFLKVTMRADPTVVSTGLSSGGGPDVGFIWGSSPGGITNPSTASAEL